MELKIESQCLRQGQLRIYPLLITEYMKWCSKGCKHHLPLTTQVENTEEQSLPGLPFLLADPGREMGFKKRRKVFHFQLSTEIPTVPSCK